jgi:hypothetical protein
MYDILKKYFAKILQGVAYMATLLTFFEFFEFSWESQIIIIVACALVYVVFCIADILREKNTVTLKENSEKYFNYFQEWYSKPGTLYIFCTDLNWMRHEAHDLISTICKKGDNCTIYLRNPLVQSDRQRLENAGVKIVTVGQHISTLQRFSLVEDDGITSLIIRNKKEKSKTIEFKEASSSSDPYLVNLTKDFLDLLDRQHDGNQHD